MIDLALDVAEALEQRGIEYALGGSVASSFFGEPRSTIDIDFAVRLAEGQLDAILKYASVEFYVPESAAREAARSASSFNLVHHQTGLKVDLFVLGESLLDRRQLARRVRISVGRAPNRMLWVTSPADQILRKLEWFRSGGETSDRQWRDVTALLSTQFEHLDMADLEDAAAQAGLADLLNRARQDSERR